MPSLIRGHVGSAGEALADKAEHLARRGELLAAQIYASVGGEAIASFSVGMAPDAPTTWDCVTKTVVAAVIVRLAETDALRLDDPVTDLVPEWQGGRGAAVSIDDLLRHQAGIDDAGYLFVLGGEAGMRKSALSAKPNQAPGRYSNVFASFLLGIAAERATGIELSQLCVDLVFAPADAGDACLSFSEESAVVAATRVVVPYRWLDGEAVRLEWRRSPEVLSAVDPSAGCVGTMAELARVLESLAGHRGTALTEVGARMCEPTVLASLDGAPAVPFGRGVMKDLGRHRGYPDWLSVASWGHSGASGIFALVEPTRELVVAARFILATSNAVMRDVLGSLASPVGQ